MQQAARPCERRTEQRTSHAWTEGGRRCPTRRVENHALYIARRQRLEAVRRLLRHHKRREGRRHGRRDALEADKRRRRRDNAAAARALARRSGSSWRSTGSIVKFVESASAVRGKSPRATGDFLRLINPFKARSRADEARFHNREARRFRRRRLCSPRSSRQLLRLKAPPNQHAPPQQHLYHVRGPQQLY